MAVMVSDPPWVVTYHPVEMREVFIEILPVADESRVITVIEVLSPSNKAVGSPGRQLYLTKQQELFESQAHLIEIDLLRRGEHTVVAPREQLLGRGNWDYLVCLHRGGQGNRCEVWPVTLRQPLPRIHVPLADGDPAVVLDLQAVFNRCYDQGAYARRLDYRSEATPPLQGEESRGPRRCCMTVGSAREAIVPLESSRPSVQPSAPVAPRHQHASRWHPHAGASPLTGLSSLILAISANVLPGRDARSRG